MSPLKNIKPFLDLSGELADALEIDHDQLVGMLRAALEEKENRDMHGRNYKSIANLITSYLDAHPEEVLWDGENRIEARYQERGTGSSYDVYNMPDDLVLALKHKNALAVDKKVLDALKHKDADADKAQGYYMPGGVTKALIVEKK